METNLIKFKGDIMDTKQHITIETKKGNYSFVFHMQTGASWGNAIDACFDFFQRINELANNSAQSIKSCQESVQEEQV